MSRVLDDEANVVLLCECEPRNYVLDAADIHRKTCLVSQLARTRPVGEGRARIVLKPAGPDLGR